MQVESVALATELALAVTRGRVVDRGDCIVVETPDQPRRGSTNRLVLAEPPRADDIARWTKRFADELPAREHVALSWAGELGPSAELRAAGFELLVLQALAAHELAAATHVALELRELRVDELPAVGALGFAAGDHHDERARLALQERAAWHAGLVARGTAHFWGAFDGAALVADVGLVELGTLARFQDVQTAPSHRRRGLAGALLATAARPAIGRGVDQLVILAEADSPAIRVYERVGFRPIERINTARIVRGATGLSG